MTIAIVMISCEMSFDGNIPPNNIGPGEGDDNKPTTPIKRRPIVPKNKLPRPRIIEDITLTIGTLNVSTRTFSDAVVEVELRTIDGNNTWRAMTINGSTEFKIEDFDTEYILTVRCEEECYEEIISFQ